MGGCQARGWAILHSRQKERLRGKMGSANPSTSRLLRRNAHTTSQCAGRLATYRQSDARNEDGHDCCPPSTALRCGRRAHPKKRPSPQLRKHAPRSIWESHEYGHGNGTFHPANHFRILPKSGTQTHSQEILGNQSRETVGRGYSDQHNRCLALTAQQAHESDGHHSLGALRSLHYSIIRTQSPSDPLSFFTSQI